MIRINLIGASDVTLVGKPNDVSQFIRSRELVRYKLLANGYSCGKSLDTQIKNVNGVLLFVRVGMLHT